MFRYFLLTLLSSFIIFSKVNAQWSEWHKVADVGNGAVYVSFKFNSDCRYGNSYYRIQNTSTNLDKCSLIFTFFYSCTANGNSGKETVTVQLKKHGITEDAGSWFSGNQVTGSGEVKWGIGDCNNSKSGSFSNSYNDNSSQNNQTDDQNIVVDKNGNPITVYGNQRSFGNNSSNLNNNNTSGSYHAQNQNVSNSNKSVNNNNENINHQKEIENMNRATIQNIQQIKERSDAQLKAINDGLNGIGNYFRERIQENIKQSYLNSLKDEESDRNDAIENFIDKLKSRNYTAGDCEECNGTGQIECSVCNGTGNVNCDICNGTGQTVGSTCNFCGGTGKKICFNCYGRKFTYCSQCKGVGKILVSASNNSSQNTFQNSNTANFTDKSVKIPCNEAAKYAQRISPTQGLNLTNQQLFLKLDSLNYFLKTFGFIEEEDDMSNDMRYAYYSGISFTNLNLIFSVIWNREDINHYNGFEDFINDSVWHSQGKISINGILKFSTSFECSQTYPLGLCFSINAVYSKLYPRYTRQKRGKSLPSEANVPWKTDNYMGDLDDDGNINVVIAQVRSYSVAQQVLHLLNDIVSYYKTE